MHDLACVAHIHTTFSDGTATVAEVVAAARQAGAQAVLITDHDTREAARQGWEGWHDGVLVLVGHEITTRVGHLLAFGVEHEIDHRGLSEPEICQRVSEQGGFAFAAHPFSRGGVVRSIIRPHPWRTVAECEPVGVELWSLITDAAERWRSPAALLRFLARPLATMEGPPPESLRAWDRLCQSHRVPAIGGLDAHQTGLRVGNRIISPMPHRRYFRLLQTHILLDRAPTLELEADRESVYTALREGRCYLAIEGLAPARGFTFEAAMASGGVVPMGGEAEQAGCTLQVRSPRPGTIVLLRNGAAVAQATGHELEYRVGDDGVYRVEVSLKIGGSERRWVISNPIYVGSGPRQADSRTIPPQAD
jgi:hypothetical protein